MNRQGRILVMDDEEYWRDLVSKVLQDGGFQVDAVETSTDALAKLQETFYHLLILDIRMQAGDFENSEGMQVLSVLKDKGLLAADPESPSPVNIIMLTAFGTIQQLREAFRDYHVTDFLDKHDFDKDPPFLEHVQSIFAHKMRINRDLDIVWQGANGAEDAVGGLWFNGDFVRRNSPLAKQLGAELDDLFCRLFYKATRVVVRPLTRGMSGTGVLRVQIFDELGGGHAVVVKFGEANMINKEHTNFEDHVKTRIGDSRSTTVFNLRRTIRLGGIVYSLLGAARDQFRNFADFYEQKEFPQIAHVLDRLFEGTCKGWYGNRGNLNPVNLTQEYVTLLDLTPERLEEARGRLRRVQGSTPLYFNSLPEKRAFVNPIQFIKGQALYSTTYQCRTHGDLNASNILIDEADNPWLIDFYRTGLGHILRDVAELDAIVRIDLLAETEATLDERYRMEETLLSIDKFSATGQLEGKLETDNPALQKAYATTVHLRKQAYKLVATNPDDDMSEYYIALLYYALKQICFYSVSALQREHALLSASLLAERLGFK